MQEFACAIGLDIFLITLTILYLDSREKTCADMSVRLTTLDHFAIEELMDAHLDAFSDYHFRFTSPILMHMMLRRGYRPDLSFAIVDQRDDILSFVWNCVSHYQGELACYDTSSGTRKAHVGQGYATRVLEATIEACAKEGIRTYWLDVIEQNIRARQVYERVGFEVTRQFAYYNGGMPQLSKYKFALPAGYQWQVTDFIMQPDWLGWMDYTPSWQNDLRCLSRVSSFIKTVIIRTEAGQEVAFGFVEPHTGDIPILAVDPDHRLLGIGRFLFLKLLEQIEASSYRVANIAHDWDGPLALVNRFGLELSSRLFEMRIRNQHLE